MGKSARCVLLACAAFAAVPAFARDVISKRERREQERTRREREPPVLKAILDRFDETVEAEQSPTVTLTVVNAGGQALNWRITRFPGWLKITEVNGTLRHLAERHVSVTILTR